MYILNQDYQSYVDKLFEKPDFSLKDLPKELQNDMFRLGELRKINSQRSVIDIGEYCSESFIVLKGVFICQYFDEELVLE